MGSVQCPFCGAQVTVDSDGAVEPQCPHCGAWAVADTGGTAGHPSELHGHVDITGSMGATMLLESRAVQGPAGEVSFVRAPYGGEVPEGLELS